MFDLELFTLCMSTSLGFGLLVASYVNSKLEVRKIGGITFVKLGKLGCSVWTSKGEK